MLNPMEVYLGNSVIVSKFLELPMERFFVNQAICPREDVIDVLANQLSLLLIETRDTKSDLIDLEMGEFS